MRWLFQSSIARNLLSSFLVVLVPITAISLFVNYLSMQIVSYEVSRSYTNSFLHMSKAFDSSLNRLKHIALSVSADSDLNALNQSPPESNIIWDYVELFKQLRIFSYIGDLDSNITVYLKGKNRIFTSRNGIDTITEQEKDYYSGREAGTLGRWEFMQQPNSGGALTLSYIQNAIYNDPGQGILVTIDVSLPQVSRFLGNLQTLYHGNAFVLDSNGYALFGSNERIDIEYVKKQLARQKGNNPIQFHYTLQGADYRVILSSSGDTGLIFGMYYPQSEFMNPILRVRAWIMVILATSLVLAGIFSLLAYRNLLLPLHKLVDAMRQVKKGDLKVRIPEDKKEELGFIFSQFNGMVGQMDYLVNEVYQQEMDIQQSKLKLLQSQINPHFLYNCLNFIYRMAKDEDTDGAARMSLYLGKYFRYATRVDKDMTTLREELENIKAYISIQDMRYPGKIGYTELVTDRLESSLIPRLLIQPIVENTLVHGVEKVGMPINICIRAMPDDRGIIIITVEDDGIGIEDVELERLNEKIKELDRESSGFGLSNIYWRLKLTFGDKAGMKLEQLPSGGLRTVIAIPDAEMGVGGGLRHV